MATLEILDALVRDEVSPGCQLTRMDLDRDGGGDILRPPILCAQLTATKPFVVYWATGGPPRSFSLPGLDPAPIVWSEREAALTIALARTLDSGSAARLNLKRTSTALCLYVLAEFAADQGFTNVPRRLRAQASGLGVNGLLAAPTFQEMEIGRDSTTEMWMTAAWFGFLHEAGHVFWSTDPSHRVLTDGDLDARIRAASAEWPQVRDHKPLDLDHLHQEISADVACVYWLWNSTSVFIRKWTGNDANPIRFVLAVAAAFSAFATLNLCGWVADDCTSTNGWGDTITAAQERDALRVGFQVRMTIAVDVATRLAVPDIDKDKDAQSFFLLALSHLKRRYHEMLTGFQQAQYDAYNPPDDA